MIIKKWPYTYIIIRALYRYDAVNGHRSRSCKPRNIAAGENYPNPFNPETTITYSIGKSGMVDLSIYNILGIKIKTLLNKYLSVGTYKINLDGTLLSSGVYFCKLQTENNMKVIKIELLK